MKFTPGPWRFEASTKTIRSIPANYWLATMDSWDGAVDHKANATLIAAAPELLSALEQLINRCEKLNDMYPKDSGMWHAMTLEARAAIAKATEKEIKP